MHMHILDEHFPCYYNDDGDGGSNEIQSFVDATGWKHIRAELLGTTHGES